MGLKPIFHWKWGSRWAPNANEIYTKNRNVHAQRQPQRQKAQRHLYSTDWRRGLVSGVMQILGLASGISVGGNAKIYQHVGISHAKFWRWGALPNANPRRQIVCVAVEYRLKRADWNSFFHLFYLKFFFFTPSVHSSLKKIEIRKKKKNPDLPTGSFFPHPAHRRQFLLKGGLSSKILCTSVQSGTVVVFIQEQPRTVKYQGRIQEGDRGGGGLSGQDLHFVDPQTSLRGEKNVAHMRVNMPRFST